MGRVFRGYPVRFVRFLRACAPAGALLVLPAAAVATPMPKTVSKHVTVSSTGVTSGKASCPRSYLALSGHVSSLSDGALARDSLSSGKRSWKFRFTSSKGRGDAVVGVRCVRLKPPRGPAHFSLGVLSGRQEFVVAGGSARTLRANCGRGYIPTGYGLDRSHAGADAAQLLLESAAPGPRSWVFRVRNAASAARPIAIQLRCMSASATGTRSGERPIAERFSIKRLGFSDTKGSGSVSHGCGRSSFALAAGYSLPSGDDIRVSAAYPSGLRGGRWSFVNPSGSDESIRTYLTCLSLRTRFR